RQAIASFAQRPTPPQKKGLRQLVAALVFDSFYPAQPAETRKLGEAGRQFVYRVVPYDIDLRFLPSETIRQENMIGQVLGRATDFSDVAGLAVSLYKGRRKIAAAQTNAVGVFNFYNLPQGTYDLRIRLQSEEIRVLKAVTSGLKD